MGELGVVAKQISPITTDGRTECDLVGSGLARLLLPKNAIVLLGDARIRHESNFANARRTILRTSAFKQREPA